MARPGWPERNKAARSFRQLRRFLHVINPHKVFGTHRRFSSSRCTSTGSQTVFPFLTTFWCVHLVLGGAFRSGRTSNVTFENRPTLMFTTVAKAMLKQGSG